MTFRVDTNGILQASARDQTTGNSQTSNISIRANMTEEELADAQARHAEAEASAGNFFADNHTSLSSLTAVCRTWPTDRGPRDPGSLCSTAPRGGVRDCLVSITKIITNCSATPRARAEISAAFHKAASHLHPDRVKRYADEELAAKRDYLCQNFGRPQGLSRPESRADYDQALAQGQKRHSFKQGGFKPRRTP